MSRGHTDRENIARAPHTHTEEPNVLLLSTAWNHHNTWLLLQWYLAGQKAKWPRNSTSRCGETSRDWLESANLITVVKWKRNSRRPATTLIWICAFIRQFMQQHSFLVQNSRGKNSFANSQFAKWTPSMQIENAIYKYRKLSLHNFFCIFNSMIQSLWCRFIH